MMTFNFLTTKGPSGQKGVRVGWRGVEGEGRK